VRAGFHVGTRLLNGAIVTQVIEDKLSQRLAELLNRSMLAALAKWDLCPHVSSQRNLGNTDDQTPHHLRGLFPLRGHQLVRCAVQRLW